MEILAGRWTEVIGNCPPKGGVARRSRQGIGLLRYNGETWREGGTKVRVDYRVINDERRREERKQYAKWYLTGKMKM